MKPATRILRKVQSGARAVVYGNAVYRKILDSGHAPERLYFTLPDAWPGDARAGLALLNEQRSLFDRQSPPQTAATLRNLRAIGTDAARNKALRLIAGWLENHDAWDEREWSPDAVGERIAGWVGFYEFYAPAAAPELIARLTASLQRQWKHLVRTAPPSLTGVPLLQAIKGLVYGGLNFEGGEKALGLACDMLRRQIATEILPDGCHVSRSPSAQLHMLRHLLDLRAAFAAADIEMPEVLRAAIGGIVPALRLFRHADGGLSIFHGGEEETSLLVDAVIATAEARGRVLRRLPAGRYERLTAGRSLLIVDCGNPPLRGVDSGGHAGLLSFEFGHGRERLIVNCGAAGQNAAPDWRMACAATAAHSTLTVEDTNACEVRDDGIASAPPIVAHRYEQDGTQFLEMSHGGYLQSFGIEYRRFLSLSADGEALHGREILTGGAGRCFTLRWHLHPSAQASLAQSGQTALVRSPSGAGWRLRVEGFDLGLEPSIYCGQGAPRRSLQLKVSGCTQGQETSIVWTLTKEKKDRPEKAEKAENTELPIPPPFVE